METAESPVPGGYNMLRPQIQDVNVSAQPDVIGEVPSVVIGIGIDHDVVIVPEPTVGVVVVIGRNLEEEAANIEPIQATTAEPPDVLRADAGSEVTVFPRMIDMIVGIAATGIVSDPAIIFCMDVRSFGMALLITVGGPLILLRRLCRL